MACSGTALLYCFLLFIGFCKYLKPFLKSQHAVVTQSLRTYLNEGSRNHILQWKFCAKENVGNGKSSRCEDFFRDTLDRPAERQSWATQVGPYLLRMPYTFNNTVITALHYCAVITPSLPRHYFSHLTRSLLVPLLCFSTSRVSKESTPILSSSENGFAKKSVFSYNFSFRNETSC
jgi:hypothetical protein